MSRYEIKSMTINDNIYSVDNINQINGHPATSITINNEYYWTNVTKHDGFYYTAIDSYSSADYVTISTKIRLDLVYSYDGLTWYDCGAGDKVYFNSDTIYFTAKEVATTDTVSLFSSYTSSNSFKCSTKCKIGGLLNYLLDRDGNAVPGEYGFAYLFYSGTAIVNADELIIKLPENTIPGYAFSNMFYSQTSLTSADITIINNPTIINTHGLDGFFKNCSSLVTTSNDLINIIHNLTEIGEFGLREFYYYCSQATNYPTQIGVSGAYFMESACYRMFYSSAIVTSPTINATINQDGDGNQFYYCFASCTKLTTINKITIDNWAERIFYYMFAYCTAITTAINSFSLPGRTKDISDNACFGMFIGCSSLLDGPSLYVLNVGYASCRVMYADCTSLETAGIIISGDTISTYGLYGTYSNTNINNAQITLSSVKTIGNYGMCDCYYQCSNLGVGYPIVNGSTVIYSTTPIYATSIGTSGLQNLYAQCPYLDSLILYTENDQIGSNGTYNWHNATDSLLNDSKYCMQMLTQSFIDDKGYGPNGAVSTWNTTIVS